MAIIITIMVLELKAPARSDLPRSRSLFPALASYVLSFVYVSTAWSRPSGSCQSAEWKARSAASGVTDENGTPSRKALENLVEQN